MTIEKAEAARLLGMKESEVVKVSAVEEGTSVLLFDASEVLIVPEDRPDASGRSGIMLRVSPGAMNRLPVYDTGEDDEAAAPPAADEGDDDAPEPAAPKPAKRAVKKAAAKHAPAADEGDDDA